MAWYNPATWFAKQTNSVPLLEPPKNPPIPLPGLSRDIDRGPQVPEGAAPQTGHYQDIPVSLLGSWTTPAITAALNGHQNGVFAQSALLAESMLGDDRVQTSLNGRIKGVTMRHLHAEPSSKDTTKQARDCVIKYWPRIFSDELLDVFMMWTVLLGFVICEVQWESVEDEEYGELWVPHLKPWHGMYTWYDQSVRSYVVITSTGNVYVEEDDPHWFQYTPFGRYRGWIRGAVRSCAVPWSVRQYALRDWARYCEVHGLPIRVLEAPAQASALDKARLFGSVRNLGAQTTVLLPQQSGQDGQKWDFRLLEAKDDSWGAFPGLLRECNMAIQLAFRGTNLTSEIQGGSYAAAQVHSDEDTSYADADCRKLCAEAKQLMRLFCAYNFGDADMCPKMRLEAPDKQDALALSQTQLNVISMADLARQQGIVLDHKTLCERFDIPYVRTEDPPEPPTAPGEPKLPTEPQPKKGSSPRGLRAVPE